MNFPTKNGMSKTHISSHNDIEICPVCYGCGMEVVPDKGARPCICLRPKQRQKLIEAIPPKIKRFGLPELSNLQPRSGLHPHDPVAKKIADEQTRIINIAKTEKDNFRNYYLSGINGCGKTTIGYALLLHAFDAGRTAVAATLSELLDEFRLYLVSDGEDRARNRPRVLPEQLCQTDKMFSIFIDEVGSPKASEYRGEAFFNLLNAIQNFGHQLIVTSNKTQRDFVTKWSAFDETHGESISRRLSENAIAMKCFL